MVIVEIFVPAFDKCYDFKLNEDVSVSVVIDEICSVISQKEHCNIDSSKGQFMLFKADSPRVLSMGLSFYENDIKNGDRLILA